MDKLSSPRRAQTNQRTHKSSRLATEAVAHSGARWQAAARQPSTIHVMRSVLPGYVRCAALLCALRMRQQGASRAPAGIAVVGAGLGGHPVRSSGCAHGCAVQH